MKPDARWLLALALLGVTGASCFVPPPPWRARELRQERYERHDDRRYERRDDERRERWREDRRERWR